ncbi:MAG: outer membrane beta-barrel protein [Gammaproteobacteria bacterium]|nr:outer membrane beta-barrel protein [Gammaproteobacteria bacterium]
MNPPYSRTAALAALIALFLAFPAQAGLYISGDFGMNFGSSMTTNGHDTDRASVCDEYINPQYATVTQTSGFEDTNCTGANRGSDSLWKNRFGSDEGPLFGLAIGFDMPESIFRTELEYFYRDTGYDDTSNVTSTGGTVFAKLGGELETAAETIDSVTSHNLFANLYIDFDNPGGITPYIGIGLGLGFTEMDYGGVFQRNIDPAAISTGDGLPNAAEIKANLAGTTTTEHEELDDTLFGYQLIAGLDYPLTDHLVAGLKARWVEYDSFKDKDEWDVLRSHASNLRRDGSEPVVYDIKVDDMEMFAVSLTLKYRF